MKRPKHSTGPTPTNRAWSAVPTVFELTEPQTDAAWLEMSLAADAAYIAQLTMLGKLAQAEVFIAQCNFKTRMKQWKQLKQQEATP